MRFLTADYIFPISSPPLRKGVVVINEDGVIEDVFPAEKFLQQIQTSDIELQTFSGIICPGFVNSHCHLELSHLKGKLQEGGGLPHFIGEIIKHRVENKEVIETAIAKAESEMIGNGIVAAGDICNTTDTIFQKQKHNLRYHNFIEVFDLHPDYAEREFQKALGLIKEFQSLDHPSSITPHAPYTVSERLLQKIDEWNQHEDEVVTIHNQETKSENEMFLFRSGALFKKLSSLGTTYDNWKAPSTSSLVYSISHLSHCKKILLVHNTYTRKNDLDALKQETRNEKPETFFCLCPNANLFIEGCLPDFKSLINSGYKITIGTDSYASNHGLSILDEMKTITKYYSTIKLDDLLQWATLNGADFYDWTNELGSIEKGKQPGLNQITNVDLVKMCPTEFSEVMPLIKRN